MNKLKYISLEKLEENPKAIFEEVYKFSVTYIVMVQSEPKFKLLPIDDTGIEKVYTEETTVDKSVKI